MILQKMKYLNVVHLVLLVIPLFLAGCQSDFGPFPMPSGYTHHAKEYKAPPGPEPVFKKIEYNIEHAKVPQSVEITYPDDVFPSNSNNITMADAPALVSIALPVPTLDTSWDNAAYDLITRLIDGFGLPTEAIYITPANQLSQTDINMEKALYRIMMQKNLNIAPALGMGPYAMHYTIKNIVGNNNRMIITLTLMINGENVTEQSGIYELGNIMEAPLMPPPPNEHYSPALTAPLSIGPN